MAEKQAHRSTLRTFKTGAVIFNHKTGEILGKGCSHHHEFSNVNTVHAERHALRESYGMRNYGNFHRPKDLSIVIVTLGRNGNFAYSSRPCVGCAQAMMNNINSIYYAERTNDGGWVINGTTPGGLMSRAHQSKALARYARDARIC
jgi:tRNA(Arg) A34 adenosine deaminase TadA